jgi:lysozyme
MLSERLIALLKRHEGFRQFPYTDSVGCLTIAYGRNLRDKGISQTEGEYLLANDVTEAETGCIRAIYGFSQLDEVRRAVLIDMAFNLGLTGLLAFHDTLEAVRQGDYDGAGECMLRTKWASQVGNRALELVTMMRLGEWPDGTKAQPSAVVPVPQPVASNTGDVFGTWWKWFKGAT